METETYSISFFGLDTKYYTRSVVGDIWNEAAQKVFRETGIVIVGEVYNRYFVEPSNEVFSGQDIIVIKSLRIPYGAGTEFEYWDAYKDVVKEVRDNLGTPRTGLITEKAILTAFEQL